MVERRAVGRIPVTFRASFGPTLAGLHEGTITDLTISGCRLESPAPIPVNTYLELWLQISPTVPRIVIELAAVRWARDGKLGVEFLGLQPEQRAQLQQFTKP
jgi:PilZ domain-containing protein